MTETAEARAYNSGWSESRAVYERIEAAPYTVDKMREDIDKGELDYERAIATAAALEATKSAHERARSWVDENIRDTYAVKAPTSVDPVERPAHYTQGDVECIDAIKAQLTPDEYRGFLRGQVAKYGWRLGRKGSPLEDAMKAQWYIARLVRELGGGK